MVTLGQARELIWDSVVREGGPAVVSGRTRPTKKSPPMVSASMIYKFRKSGLLGTDSVNALAPILVDITAETWLAAMGVESPEAQAS